MKKSLVIGQANGMDIVLEGKALQFYEKLCDEEKEKFKNATVKAIEQNKD